MRIVNYGELLQLTLYPDWFPINAYLVREPDGLTLIDTTIAQGASSLAKAASDQNLPIVRILLTHAHGDHVGGLDELHALYPEAEVCVSARTARLLTGDRTAEPGEPETPLRGSYSRRKTLPNRLIADGDVIGSLVAVACPGHAPGQMAYYDSRNGALICGDAFQTQAGVAVAGDARALFPFPAWATHLKLTALASARRLQTLNFALLAPGHGPVLREPAAAIDHAIRRAASKWERQ